MAPAFDYPSDWAIIRDLESERDRLLKIIDNLEKENKYLKETLKRVTTIKEEYKDEQLYEIRRKTEDSYPDGKAGCNQEE